MGINQNRQLISFTTSLGKDKFILTSLEGYEEISKPYYFTLKAFSEDLTINQQSLVGKTAFCSLQNSEQEPRYFHGYIKQFTKNNTKLRNIREYTFEIVPWIWFLSLSQDCQIFQEKSVIEICEEIFKKFNFSDYKLNLTQSYPKRDYCVQYNETYLSFISRLLEDEGIFYYFEHAQDKHTLILSDLSSQCSYNYHKEISYAQGSFFNDHLNEWEQAYNFCSGEFDHVDYDFTKPTQNLSASIKTSVKFDKIQIYKVFKFPGGYTDKDGGSKLSRIRMEELEVNHNSVKVQSNLNQISPGTKFILKSEENFTDEQEFLITSVYHKAKDSTHKLYSNLSNENQEIQLYTNTFKAIPSSIPYRPTQLTLKPTIKGLQMAKVTGPSQEEIYTDQYGRIKVQFLWDRYGKNNEMSSCWIRVMQQWTGSQWGTLYIPRVGQEVIIDFLEGNPDCPIVVGCLYNGQNKPSYTLPDNKTQSGIKTHSTPNGEAYENNELRFEDKKGQEQIFMHAQKDFQRIVENNDTLKIKGQQQETIQKDRKKSIEEGNDSLEIKKGNQTIILDAGNQNLKISQGNRETTINMGNDNLHLQQGNYSIKLDLGKVNIEAMQAIQLVVGQNSLKIDQTGVTIEGLMIKINGKLVELNADALLQLKGALVMIN